MEQKKKKNAVNSILFRSWISFIVLALGIIIAVWLGEIVVFSTLFNEMRTEMINDTNGKDEYSRVAVHETYDGNNDRIGISAAEDLAKYSAIVFEADIKIDSKSGGLTYQFYLSSSNQEAANVAYCIYFSVNGGKLSLQDMSNTSGSTSRSCVITDAIYNANEWNRIKIEYFIFSQ